MSPRTGRRVHLACLVLWLVVGTPVSIYLRQSIAWLVFLSVYAIVVSHWAGWSAERPGEVFNEEDAQPTDHARRRDRSVSRDTRECSRA